MKKIFIFFIIFNPIMYSAMSTEDEQAYEDTLLFATKENQIALLNKFTAELSVKDADSLTQILQKVIPEEKDPEILEKMIKLIPFFKLEGFDQVLSQLYLDFNQTPKLQIQILNTKKELHQTDLEQEIMNNLINKEIDPNLMIASLQYTTILSNAQIPNIVATMLQEQQNNVLKSTDQDALILTLIEISGKLNDSRITESLKAILSKENFDNGDSDDTQFNLDVKTATMKSLIQLGDPEAITQISAFIQNENEILAEGALFALSTQSDFDLSAYQETIFKHLRMNDPKIRLKYLDILKKLPSSEKKERFLKYLVKKDQDSEIRMKAFEILDQTQSDSAKELFLNTFEKQIDSSDINDQLSHQITILSAMNSSKIILNNQEYYQQNLEQTFFNHSIFIQEKILQSFSHQIEYHNPIFIQNTLQTYLKELKYKNNIQADKNIEILFTILKKNETFDQISELVEPFIFDSNNPLMEKSIQLLISKDLEQGKLFLIETLGRIYEPSPKTDTTKKQVHYSSKLKEMIWMSMSRVKPSIPQEQMQSYFDIEKSISMRRIIEMTMKRYGYSPQMTNSLQKN